MYISLESAPCSAAFFSPRRCVASPCIWLTREASLPSAMGRKGSPRVGAPIAPAWTTDHMARRVATSRALALTRTTTARTGGITIQSARPTTIGMTAIAAIRPAHGRAAPRLCPNQRSPTAEASRAVISQLGHSNNRGFPTPWSCTPA